MSWLGDVHRRIQQNGCEHHDSATEYGKIARQLLPIISKPNQQLGGEQGRVSFFVEPCNELWHLACDRRRRYSQGSQPMDGAPWWVTIVTLLFAIWGAGLSTYLAIQHLPT